MDVRVNKNDKMVEWDVGGKTISIYNEYTLYAFKHGKGMLMIKEKYETSDSGFSAYNEEGNLVFSYRSLGNHLNYRNKDISVINGAIISADYEEEVLELDKIPMALEVVNQFIKSNSNKELGKLKTMLDCVIGENIMPEYID